MKRVRLGFTLIEVALFLVITAVVFMGITIGTQNSIFQQRYNDTVQNYAEFLRTVYSQVNNVQSDGNGQSDKAIYGKLVTYGQSYDLAGNEIADGQRIFTYDVIGDVGEDLATGDSILEQLVNLDANVVINDDGYKLVGYPEDYKPRWGARIQTNAGWGDDGYDDFIGALLIVRHPKSGRVYTLAMVGQTIEVNKILRTYRLDGNIEPVKNLLKTYLADQDNGFSSMELNFCVNPNGVERSNLRRDVRLIAGARNSSGIQIMPDGEGCN